MLENKIHKKIKRGSEKSFGIVFFIFFMIISFYPFFIDGTIRIWALLIGVIFLILGIFFPKILFLPNKLWFQIGILLGKIISPIFMGVVYFFSVTPIGIILRLIGKDVLNQKINKKTKSYWINRKDPIGSMKNQF